MVRADGSSSRATNWNRSTASRWPRTALLAALAAMVIGWAAPVLAQADLSVSMSDSPDPVDVAATLSYALTVTNAGPDPASNAVVSLTLDGDLAYVGATSPGWSCGHAAGVVTCTRASFAVSTANLSVTATAPLTPAAISSSAAVSSATADANPGNNSSGAVATTVASADLSLTMVDAPDPVDGGDNLGYTVSITNGGPERAASVAVELSLDSALSFVSASGTGWSCVHAAGVVTCTRATLNPGTAPNIAVVTTAPAAADSLSTTATVSSATYDPDSGDATDSEATTVVAVADLGVSLGDSPDPVEAGQTLSYTLEVTNNGPHPAPSVQVGTTLDGALAFASATGTGWSCAHAAGVVTCTRSSLAVAATSTITVTATAPANGATVTTDTTVSSAGRDDVPGNDSDSEATVVTPRADLGAGVTIVAAAAVPGQTRLVATVTVTNHGPSDVVGAEVAVPQPTFLAGTQWSCAITAGSGACHQPGGAGPVSTRVDLDAAATATLSLVAWADADAGAGSRSLSATVIAPAGVVDPTAGNDSASDSVTLNPQATLTVSKSNGLSALSEGQSFTYSIVVGNAGPSTDAAVSVTDSFPAQLNGHPGLCGNSATPCWTCQPGPVLAVAARAVEGQGGVSGLEGARAVAVSPDGLHVYVAGGADDALTVFTRTVGPSGGLSYAGTQSGVAGAAGLAISPDGAHVYATAAASNRVVVFSRNAGSGLLTQLEAEEDGLDDATDAGGVVDGLLGARGVAVSPDGAHVYVVSPVDGAVATFARAATGRLSFVAATVHADLAGAVRVALSGDGASLYVAATDADAVVGFARDRVAASAGFGTLDGRQAYRPSGFTEPTALAVSGDGDHLYVTGRDGVRSAVLVMSRSAAGVLSEVQRSTSAVDGASDVAVSPDGSRVVVTAAAVDAVAVLQRTAATGQLALLGSVGSAQVDGLGAATSLAVTPDGSQVVVTGEAAGAAVANAAVALAMTAGASCTAGGSGSIATSAVVPAGASVVYTVAARVLPGTTVDVCNTASASGLSTDSDQDCDPVTLATDLEVLTSDGITAASPGEELATTVTVTNRGILNVAGARVDGSFPVFNGSSVLAGFTAGSVTWSCVASGGGCCTSGSSNCGTAGSPVTGSGDIVGRLVDLPPGAAVVYSVAAEIHPSATGTLANAATVSLPSGVGDPNLANNTGQDADTALLPVADLVILKQHGAVSGTTAGYTITVDNLGPSTAVGATVQDAFPPGLSGASWSCTASGGGSCTAGPVAGDLLDTVTVPPGATLSYQVTATLVDPAPDPVVVNTASVTGGNAVDPSATNNLSTDQLVLAASVDLSVQKTDGRVEAVPGDPLTYVITVTNAGPDAVVGARVLDLLPADLVDVSWSCDATPPVPGEVAPLELFSLAGAQAAAVSPDGAQVYAVAAAAAASGQLTAFTRSSEPGPLFGKLGVLMTLDQGDVAALAGGSDVVVAPDGRHVYVASAGSNAVLVFARDWNPLSPSFGALTAVASATVVDGVGGVDGLAGAAALALSPDGTHLYVAGAADDAVAVFSRDSASGALDWVERESDGGGSSALAGAAALALSPDGAHLYVAGFDDAAVAVFARDAGSGELSWLEDQVDGGGGVTDLVGASAVVVSPDGAQVYVAAASDGAVVAFQRDAASGSGGFGRLSFDLAYPGTTAVPPAAVNNLAGVSGLHLTGDGQHLIAAATAADSLLVFRRNTGTGLLTHQELLQDGAASVDGLEGVGAVTSSPDGAHLYTAAAGDGRLGVFSRRQPDPAFAFVEVEVDGVDDPVDAGGTVDGLLGARDVAVTPDGQHLIAVGFADDQVAVFARDAGEGSTPSSRGLHLSFQQVVSGVPGNALDGAGAVVATTSTVYVAAENASTVVVLSRDPGTGTLSFAQTVRDGVGGVDGLSGVSSIALSPSGNHLYAAGQFDAAVAIFAITAGTGQLSYAGLVRNGVDGVEGLTGVSDLALSPDGRQLYAVSRTDDAVVVFERATGGGLSFVQAIRDGQSGSDGLDRAMSVAVSPDGGHVYVAGANDNAIASFRRNGDETSPSFGRLIFSGLTKDGVNGVDGLAGVRSLQVSHDGRRVVAVGEFDHALAVFARIDNPTSPAFGSLAPIETRFDGVDGVNGLAQANGVALSADGRHTYVASFGDHAVASFIRRSGSRCSAGGTGSIDDEVDIGFGGSVVYTVAATVRPGASGSLSNTVTVSVPAGVTDLDPSDNSATDVDLLTPESDLAVSKSNGVSSLAAGGTVSYAITVTNAGPSDARQALVSDAFGADFTTVEWSCRALGSGALSEVAVVAGLAGLGAPSAVAVSPDPDGGGPLPGGAHVYVAGFASNSLAVFARDPFSGALTLVEVATDGVAGVDGLAGTSAVAVSPDGSYVVVGGQLDDAVALFARNPATGAVTYQMRLRDGVGGVDGLDQVTAIVVNADGSRLYVTGANDDAVAILAHAGGALSFVDVLRDGVGGVDGLDGASGLALSPDGASLYATGFNDGAVAVFAVSAAGLSFVERKNVAATAGLAGAAAVAVSPDGAQVYVAGASDAAVVVFSRNASSGELTPLEVAGDGVNGVEGLAGARALALSGDGLHLYAAGQAVDSIVLLRRDAVSGRLDFAERLRDGVGSDSLNGVGGLALSPGGEHLYATAFADDAVVALARSADSDCPASGAGALAELVDVAAGGRLELTATAVLRSDAVGTPCPAPDAARQCVVNSATVAAPATSRPDPVTADNSAVDVDFLSRRADLAITKDDGLAELDGLAGASAVAVDPLAGAAVYVAGPADSGIAVFTRSVVPGSDFGRLDFASFVRDGVDGVDGLGGVAGLALSRDGAHLYAAGASDNAVAAFARGAGGELAVLEVERNGIGGVGGLLGAAALALSADDQHLYVVGGDDNAVVAFRRDSAGVSADFGELSYLATVEQGVAGAAGLERPSAVAVSPDGGHVYVTGALQGTVAVLVRDRDPGSSGFGQLSYLEHHRDGVAGVDGLAAAAALAVVDDFVYVAGADDGAVAVFARDSDAGSPSFGRLSFVTSTGAVPGLAGVSGLVLGPTPGDQLYATAADGGAVAVFGRDSDPGSASYGALTFVAVIHDGDVHGSSVVEGLAGAAALAASADGEHVYVAAAASGAAVAFARDSDPLSPALGELSFLAAQLDGSGGAPPGSDVTYLITVNNLGPSNVVNAQVTDLFPVEFEDVSWVCSTQGAGSSCDTPSGVGDLDEEVDLPVGGQVIFEATGRLRPGVSGTLSNTATVAPPPGVIDPVLGNNSATDDDTLLAAMADLMVSKDDGVVEVVAGQAVTYTMVVSNLGPSHAAGVRVSDRLPEAIHSASWSCVADPEPGLLSYVEGESDGAAGVDGLDAVAAVAVSHDGGRVFSVAAADHALASFRRDLRNGELEFLGAAVDGAAGVDGLAGASAVVVSPDDRHVYVAGSADDAVAVFAVDGAGVSFVELDRDGVAGVNGLGGVADLALSPDGASLYAAGAADNAVAVFDRSSASGALSLRQVTIDGVGGVSGIGGVTAVAVSPDGSHVYAAGQGDDAVVVFRRAGNGSLSFLGRVRDGFDGIPAGTLLDPVDLAVSRDGSQLLVTALASDALLVFDRDATSGALSFAAVHRDGAAGVSGLGGPRSVVESSDGGQVYVAGSGAGAVAVFRRAASGELSFLGAVSGSSPGFGALDGLRALAASGDGRHLYGAAATVDTVVALARHPGSTCTATGSGELLDSADIAPGGSLTYRLSGVVAAGLPATTTAVVNEVVVSVAGAVIDPDRSNNRAEDVDLLVARADLAISKDDGLSAVRAGEAISYAITVANLGPSDVSGVMVSDLVPTYPSDPAGLAPASISWGCAGEAPLAVVASHVDGVDGVEGLAATRWVVVRPDLEASGRELVFATGAGDSAVAVFARSTVPGAGFGELSFLSALADGDVVAGGTVDGLAGAAGLALSPDGNHLYVAGGGEAAVAVLAVDASSGDLDFVEAAVNGVDGVDGLAGASSVAVSPDGASVYVTGRDADAVVVFARDRTSGALSYVEREKEGFGGVPLVALDGARHVVVTADGSHVYVAAEAADAVVTFARDPVTGALELVDVLRNLDIRSGVTVNGLDFVRALAVSRAGEHLYAASLADDAVVAFARDGASGRLSLLEVYRNGVAGVVGLDGATALALSDDGAFLAAVGLNSDAVVGFRRDWASGRLAPSGMVAAASLDGAAGVVVSPDGAHLIVAASNAAALTLVARRPSASCPADGVGAPVAATLDLAVGASVTLTVSGTVHPAARGTVLNTATVAPPPGVVDPVAANDSASDATAIEVASDLVLSKTNGVSTVVAGLPVSYTVALANRGPSDAFGVAVHDLLPLELEAEQWSCVATAGSTCSAGPVAGNVVDAADVRAGGSVTYTVSAVVASTASGTLVNGATATLAEGTDPTPGDTAAVDSDPIVSVTNLSIGKSNGVASVVPGTPVSYTIVAANAGPSHLAAGTVRDTLSPQLQGATWSCTPSAGSSCSASGSGSFADPVAIAANGSVSYTVTATVAPAATGTLANTASVQAGGGATDPALTDNVAADSDPLTPQADLALGVDDDLDPAVTGHPLVYTLTVTNAGPSTATGGAVSTALPAGVTLIDTIGCTQDPSGVPSCGVGTLGPGAAKVVTVAVDIDEGVLGTVVATASVTAATPDPVATNNTASEATVVEPWADLAALKVDATDPVVAGTELTYTITVTNNSPYPAPSVVVSDSLPVGVSPLATVGCAEDGSGGGIPTCTLGTIAAGGQSSYVLTVRVDSATLGTIVNDAEVASPLFDPELGDNLASASTTVVAEADLWASKDNGQTALVNGEAVTYTVTIGNHGPSHASAADVVDAMPSELLNVSWSCAAAAGAFCAPSGLGNLLLDTVELAVGAAVTYTVSATVDPALAHGAAVTNTVTVAAAGALTDPDASDNAATDADPIDTLVFADGFESGDSSLWSRTQPPALPPPTAGEGEEELW